MGSRYLYTTPTAIRMFMKFGEQWVTKHDLSTLRLLGTVGEPINPEAWKWYYRFIGKEKLAIIDTWWQTETGGFMIAPLSRTGACPVETRFSHKPVAKHTMPKSTTRKVIKRPQEPKDFW